MKLAGTCRDCGEAMVLIAVGDSDPHPIAATIKLCAKSPTQQCRPAPLPTADERRHAELRREQTRRWGGAVQRRAKRR